MRAAIAIAVLVAGCSSSPRDYDPVKGAEFRFDARQLVESIDPICPLTERNDLLGRYQPVLDRFAKLKREISGSLATDLAIVEADEAYRRSVTVVECAATDTADTDRYLSNKIKMMMNNMGRMEAIAQKQGGA